VYLSATAQVIPQKFGKGLQVYGKDSSFYMHFGLRFQTLFSNNWTVIDGKLDDYQANLLIRRSRLKFDGYVLDPKLTYKFELGLSNRDISGGDGDEHGNTSNVILDAVMAYTFYKNLSIQFGQTKLPGNRERVVSSANLQFVDRSRLNSRFNIDRDIGFQLKNEHTLGQDFQIQETIAFSQGEGRNIIEGHFDGYDYTFHVDVLPFGSFKSKGDYVGSATVREPKPKLALGFTYDINNNAVRERGQLGDFILDNNGTYFGKTLHTFFADCMVKYKGLSIMAEYADKRTADRTPAVFDTAGAQIGTFYTGSAISLQTGFLFDNNWEIAGRYTQINPDAGVSNDETEYTLGISKFIVGHKLKVQTDFSYRDITGRNNLFSWRFQTELHF
jgi:hypothetical protein